MNIAQILGGKQMSDLRAKTCKELRDMAKDLGIVGRWDMNKAQLIEAIEAISYDDSEITFETGCVISKKTTLEYLSNAEPGTLVAFKKRKTDAAMSGKFVEVNDGEVVVETKMGTIFKLMPADIIWVKTGARWPRWVFNLFMTKEVTNDNAISKV